jgi:multiple sugar transport system permease protein
MADTRAASLTPTPGRSATPTAGGKRWERRWWGTHPLLIAVGVLMLYPVLWMLTSSFKPTPIIFQDAGLWPREFTLENYVRGWTALRVPFATFFGNSFVVAGAAVIGNLLTCSMAAYAFARLEFRWKRVWFGLMLLTIMLPQHVQIVPQYVVFQRLGWVDTFLPLIVPHFLATSPFFIFLIVQFMRGIPRDLDDAARVDGAGPWEIYWRIVLPLTRPALVTTAIFTFIWTYDDFFSQLLYLSNVTRYTVPMALRLFLDSSGESSWGALFAMSILSLVPVLALFVFFQRLIIQGISTSGLKG